MAEIDIIPLREKKKLLVNFLGYEFRRNLPMKPNGYQLPENFNTALYLSTGLTEEIALDQIPFDKDLCLCMNHVVAKMERLEYGKGKEVTFTLDTYYAQVRVGKMPHFGLGKWATYGGSDKVAAVFNACVDFVEMYNKNPKLWKQKL